MQRSEIDEAVERAGGLVAERYVFEDVAAQLRDVLAAGRYPSDDLEALAAQVTRDLQSVNGDLHLRLRHHAEPIPADWDDPAQDAEYARAGGTKPLYVLVGPATFSGAEELAYDLQQLRKSPVVGERTRGGAHPCESFRVHPHLELTIPIARAIGATTGTNWEGTGITPDVPVPAPDALDTAHHLALSAIGAPVDRTDQAADAFAGNRP